MRRSILLIAALCPAGCMHPFQSTYRIDDPETMKAKLREQIPVGTPVTQAQQFMEYEGFKCRDESNGSFIERTWFGDKEPLHEDLDFVHCQRAQSAGFMMGRIWDVALVHDGTVVTDILVSHYLDGP